MLFKFFYKALSASCMITLVSYLSLNPTSIVSGKGGCYESGRSDQDRFDGKPDYFALFDGHGSSVAVADYLKKNLYPLFQKNLLGGKSIPQAFIDSFIFIDREMYEKGIEGGSTALVAYVDEENHKLYIANTGDCRAVLSSMEKARILSKDLVAADEKEQIRINKIGDLITKGESGEYRVNAGGHGAIVSRSLGDWGFKNYNNSFGADSSQHLISPYPHITECNLTKGDTFLILASDGLWDVCGNQEAVNSIKATLQTMTPKDCATALVTTASQRWGGYDEKDDITVIIITFDQKQLPPPVVGSENKMTITDSDPFVEDQSVTL